MFTQRRVQFHAVADGDVVDLAALGQQDPGDAVQRAGVVQRVAASGGLAVSAHPREAGGVQKLACLLDKPGMCFWPRHNPNRRNGTAAAT
jgi:hypothetical protein